MSLFLFLTRSPRCTRQYHQHKIQKHLHLFLLLIRIGRRIRYDRIAPQPKQQIHQITAQKYLHHPISSHIRRRRPKIIHHKHHKTHQSTHRHHRYTQLPPPPQRPPIPPRNPNPKREHIHQKRNHTNHQLQHPKHPKQYTELRAPVLREEHIPPNNIPRRVVVPLHPVMVTRKHQQQLHKDHPKRREQCLLLNEMDLDALGAFHCSDGHADDYEGDD